MFKMYFTIYTHTQTPKFITQWCRYEKCNGLTTRNIWFHLPLVNLPQILSNYKSRLIDEVIGKRIKCLCIT